MKFRNMVFAAMITTALFTGCASGTTEESTNSDNEAAVTSTDKIDVKDDYDVMLTQLKEVFVNNMTDKDGSYLESFYGIDPESVDSYMLLQAEDVRLADTVVVLKLKDAGNVDSTKQTFETVKTNLAEQYQNYDPKQSEVMNQAVIGSKDSYVYFAVATNSNELASIIEKNID
jgi:hypothetical protein